MSETIISEQMHVIDSEVDRARIRAAIEVLQRDVTAHVASDRAALDDIDDKLDRLIATGIRTSALVKLALGLIVATGAAAGWVTQHYVADIVQAELQKEHL